MRLEDKFASEIEAARILGNRYPIDIYGRFPWDRSERRGKATTLSKASLGEFCFAVLSVGGEISSFYAFAKYHRSSVFIRVRLSITQKHVIENETGYRFDPPPIASVGVREL